MSEGELILYSTDDGTTTVGLRAVDGTVWLSQREIATLFDKDVRTVNEHIKNLFSEGECDPEATIRKFRIVQTEGLRQVEREVETYNLDVILSFNERDVLTHAGHLRMDVAQKLAAERFEVFDAHRRAAEAVAADEADIAQLEAMEKDAKGRKKGGGDA